MSTSGFCSQLGSSLFGTQLISTKRQGSGQWDKAIHVGNRKSRLSVANNKAQINGSVVSEPTRDAKTSMDSAPGAVDRFPVVQREINSRSRRSSRDSVELPGVRSREQASVVKLQERSTGAAVLEYMASAIGVVGADAGPPRWFCPVDARANPTIVPNAAHPLPLLLFLPGIDGTGMGLSLQHRSLSRLCDIMCLNVPPSDRTRFPELVEMVTEEVERQLSANPKRPLLLLGESFGAMLALAVAASCPDLPLHLVLINSATAFKQTQLQPLLPLLGLVPPQLYSSIPLLLCTTLGDPLRMAQVGVDGAAPPWEQTRQLAQNLVAMLPALPSVVNILPQATLKWKLELLDEGCSYTEPLLPRVTAPSLILASGQDRMLPSLEEGLRLQKLLPAVTLRTFRNSGHTLLLEDGVDVGSLLKSTGFFSKVTGKTDLVTGFIPPSPEEVQRARQGLTQVVRALSSPVSFSTTADGTVERGLHNLPLAGKPLLFVGNHQSFALDLGTVIDEVLTETGLLLRGLAHPMVMGQGVAEAPQSSPGEGTEEGGLSDFFRTFGAVPVSGTSLYKLLANQQAALLFPGGVREAYRRKEEEYKLFWPDTPEFVRMAMRHEATIVPFGVIGLDDNFEFLLDAPEILRLPVIGERISKSISNLPRAREEERQGVAEELFVPPLAVPKGIPRLYLLFQKPISTAGMRGSINDKDKVKELYRQVKNEVEHALSYLQRKREEDPYKDALPRITYEASWGGKQAPTFEP